MWAPRPFLEPVPKAFTGQALRPAQKLADQKKKKKGGKQSSFFHDKKKKERKGTLRPEMQAGLLETCPQQTSLWAVIAGASQGR